MKYLLPFFLLSMGLLACTADGKGTAALSADEDPLPVADTAAIDAPVMPLLVGDSVINRAARFYAGISREGIELSRVEQGQWEGYALKMRDAVASSQKTILPMDSLMARDMSDLREQCDYVFYPFSGPDFLYPITMFPDAGHFFLAGLEWTGRPLSVIVPDADHYRRYTGMLDVYMRSSFFRTKSMDRDLDNDAIDGTVPVITMLMAIKGYEVIRVGYKTWTDDGQMEDANMVTNLAEIRFFHPDRPRHEQVLYYLSGDLSDDTFDERLSHFMANTLAAHHTVTFFKAASYLLHQPSFTKMRDNVCRYTQAIVGDDSGMPYRYIKDDFDVTLYGKYQRPIKLFGEHDFQSDLQALYDSVAVRPLPFRIGYNRNSNWMVARRR